MKNERGLTLVEVLAVVVVGSIIIGIASQVMVSGFKTYERIRTEGDLRDEADWIMGSMIRDLYVLKVSDLKSRELAGPDYYFLLKDGKKLGFYDGRVFSREGEIHTKDNEISLVPETSNGNGTKITETEEDQYEINLVLEKDGEQLELRSVIGLIPDSGDGQGAN
ncbi:prepilin-type N-terminal cleavage/methylation domain-containing protein [Aciduricibacillus chroicocephali]|uniref:Prepilin-type N-terminal cleavage/methylation domain-containing protein n=1 Tax=Aciduricibacillus chroicocephali TaxID=3054939 RepID=A0ABY9KWN4_9BACI|nr:prepilin-type N-terminal cleavage/methylation domain-containing protein [Bacillaceae bacterium 44XB]